ncbi:MAG: VWA domain-containing protein [Burkholderiales bacterium]
MSTLAASAAAGTQEAADSRPTTAATVAFADIQRALALFAQGIAGAPLHLEPRAAARTDASRRRLEREAQTLVLPPAVGIHPSMAQNRGAYRAAVLHQVGYRQFGTYAFRLAVAATRMTLPLAPPSPARSPVLRPGSMRRTDLERFFALALRPALLRRLFVTLEDWRVDAALRRTYPGARADLDRACAHALAGRPALGTLRPAARLIEALVQASLGASHAPLAALIDDTRLAQLLELAAPVERESADVYSSAAAALNIHALLLERAPRVRRSAAAPHGVALPEGGESADASAGGQDDIDDGIAEAAREEFDGPGVDFRGEFAPDLELLMSEDAQGGMITGESLTTTPVPSDAKQEAESGATPAKLRAASARGKREIARSFLYDEWDCHSETYRRAWCRVREERLRGEAPDFMADLRRRHGALARELRRSFGLLRPESWLRVHRAVDGEEPDLDRVIEALIDRRSGGAGDDLVYTRRDRGRREVAAAFLVDLSASTDFPVPEVEAGTAQSTAPAGAVAPTTSDPYVWGRFGGPIDATPIGPKRRVVDVERDALALMCEALDRLGDAYAVYGFSGSGRDNVEFLIARDFSDSSASRTRAALAAMKPMRSTRMGPAIRHAATKLKRRAERVKTLIVVSDGYPQDVDYGPDPSDEAYGIADTARALAEAERAGIATFCITVDPAGHDYLKRMCAPGRYMVIGDVNTLPAELARTYRALTL